MRSARTGTQRQTQPATTSSLHRERAAFPIRFLSPPRGRAASACPLRRRVKRQGRISGAGAGLLSAPSCRPTAEDQLWITPLGLPWRAGAALGSKCCRCRAQRSGAGPLRRASHGDREAQRRTISASAACLSSLRLCRAADDRICWRCWPLDWRRQLMAPSESGSSSARFERALPSAALPPAGPAGGARHRRAAAAGPGSTASSTRRSWCSHFCALQRLQDAPPSSALLSAGSTAPVQALTLTCGMLTFGVLLRCWRAEHARSTPRRVLGKPPRGPSQAVDAVGTASIAEPAPQASSRPEDSQVDAPARRSSACSVPLGFACGGQGRLDAHPLRDATHTPPAGMRGLLAVPDRSHIPHSPLAVWRCALAEVLWDHSTRQTENGWCSDNDD